MYRVSNRASRMLSIKNQRIMSKKEVTIKDLCKSDTANRNGIENVPGDVEIACMEALIRYVVNPIMNHYPSAAITSGFRCPKLNRIVGGVANSQHVKGQAVDMTIVIPGYTLKESIMDLYQYITFNLRFDQLIVYPTFVHISFVVFGNRMEVINKAPMCYPSIPKRARL